MIISDKEKFFLGLIENGLFSISPEGIVKNNKTNKIVSKKPDSGGYCRLSYSYNGRILKVLVHRLVYILYGKEPLTEEFPLVNHKDGIKTNNSISNLERSNLSHNQKHAYDNGLNYVSEKSIIGLSIKHDGENGPSAKLTHEQVREIRSLYRNKNITMKKLGLIYGLHDSTICDIINHKTYKNA